MSEQVSAQAGPSGASPQTSTTGPPSQSLREKLLLLRARSRATLAAGQVKEDEFSEAIKNYSTPHNFRDPQSLVDHDRLERSRLQQTQLQQSRSEQNRLDQSRMEVQQLRLPVVSPLPVRSLQATPHTPNHPSKLGQHSEISESQDTLALSPADLGEMEFVIPFSMNTRIKDQYISTINDYQQAIQGLMRVEIPNDKILMQVRQMLDRVNQITTHIDLDAEDDTAAQGQELADEEATWAENCSTKFKFIRHLFERVKQHDLHIAIMARSGRLLDILETFLKGRRVRYTRPDIVSRSHAAVGKGRLHVTLLASGPDGAAYLSRPATLVIAFDGSFNAQDIQVKSLRGHMVNVGQLAPVIHLLVYGSAEHVACCIPRSIDSLKRLRMIIKCMTQTRHNVGELLSEEFGAAAAAEEVAAFLKVGALEKDWTFPAIRPIEGLEMDESPRPENTHESDSRSLPTTSPMSRQSSNQKRVLDIDMNASTKSKRQKIVTKGEEPHVNDSRQSLSRPDVAEELKQTHEDLDTARTTCASLRKELNMGAKAAEAEQASEKAKHQKTKQMLQEYIESLEDLQLRFEASHKKCRTVSASNEELEVELDKAVSQTRRQSADIARINEKNTTFKAVLKDAHEALLNSTEPSVAERESFRSQIRTLTETNAGLEKKVSSLNNDLGYCREQYQSASNAAAEAATRVTELEAEVIMAERKVKQSSEATKLRSLNQNSENVSQRTELEELRLEVKNRDDLLRRKEEELRDLRHGRAGVVTRGNSVGGGKSSRGASPAVGAGAGVGGYMGPGGGGGTGGGGKFGGSSLRFG